MLRGCRSHTGVGRNLDTYRGYYVGKYIEFDGSLYELEVARDGKRVKVTAAKDVPMGRLRLPKGITETRIGGTMGLFDRTCEDGLVELPAGTYRFNHWIMQRRDESGALWKLRGMHFQHTEPFEVRAGEETDVDTGEPLKATLDVRKFGRRYYSFSAGELESESAGGLELTLGRGDPPGPQLHIKNKDGTYDRAFELIRRRGGVRSLSWRKPDNADGPFTATLEYNMPFEVGCETYIIDEAPNAPAKQRP